jgi:hypothetical protein
MADIALDVVRTTPPALRLDGNADSLTPVTRSNDGTGNGGKADVVGRSAQLFLKFIWRAVWINN